MNLDYDYNTGSFTLAKPYERFIPLEVQPMAFGYDADITIVTVPVGFRTDFASVPRLLWSIIPPIGTYSGAAVIHDYLYTQHPAGRKWCDAVFDCLMKEDGVGWIERKIMWVAVRIFGRKPYDG